MCPIVPWQDFGRGALSCLFGCQGRVESSRIQAGEGGNGEAHPKPMERLHWGTLFPQAEGPTPVGRLLPSCPGSDNCFMERVAEELWVKKVLTGQEGRIPPYRLGDRPREVKQPGHGSQSHTVAKSACLRVRNRSGSPTTCFLHRPGKLLEFPKP